MKLEEYLIEQGAKLQEKIEQLRSENKAEESNKCTFQPSISRKSQNLASFKSKRNSLNSPVSSSRIQGFNKFEILFEDAKRRKEHSERFQNLNPDSECTFQPNTCEGSKLILNNLKMNSVPFIQIITLPLKSQNM